MIKNSMASIARARRNLIVDLDNESSAPSNRRSSRLKQTQVPVSTKKKKATPPIVPEETQDADPDTQHHDTDTQHHDTDAQHTVASALKQSDLASSTTTQANSGVGLAVTILLFVSISLVIAYLCSGIFQGLIAVRLSNGTDVYLNTLNGHQALNVAGIFQGLIAVRLSNGTDVYLNTLNGHQALNVAGLLSSIVTAALIALTCGLFSGIVTYFDSCKPGVIPPTPLSPAKHRIPSGHSYHSGYVMTIMNSVLMFCYCVWYQRTSYYVPQ